MKIGIVFGMEFSKPNGISRYVIEILERMSGEHEVHLIISDNDFTHQGIKIHRTFLSGLSGLKIKTNILYLRSFLHVCNMTTRLIINSVYNPVFSKKIKARYDLDVIHSQSIDSLSADVVTMHACYKAARKDQCKEEKSHFLKRIAGSILFLPFNYSYLLTEKRILENSKKIIAVSQRLKEELIDQYRIPEKKIVVIPNGVDLQKFRPDPVKRIEIRDRYGISEDDIVLIFAGNMFRLKGLDHILASISNIPEVRLFIVGEDPNIDDYKLRSTRMGIRERVIFTGRIIKGIEQYYAASDIFLLPSASEGFPLTCLEAAATGLPLIGTRISGIEEIIKEGYNGFFVSRNSEDIREKIQALVQDVQLRRQMGGNARRTAEKYSWEKVVEQTLRVYRDVADET